MGARPAWAAVGGAGCRAMTGGRTLTIGLHLAFMRIGNTERRHGSRMIQSCLCASGGRGQRWKKIQAMGG